MTLGPTNTEEARLLDNVISSRGANVQIALFNVPSTVTITAMSQSGNLVTCTASGHGTAADDIVQIAGCTPSGYNGHYRVVSVSGTSCTFNAPAALGTVTVLGTAGKWAELSGTGYAKVSIAGSSSWNAASGGAPTTKTGPATGTTWAFPQAGAQWADSSHPAVGFRLYDSGASAYFWAGTLTTPTQINALDTVQFDPSNVITLQLGDQADPF